MTQHQCTAARFRAKCSPHCSMLFCKTGSQQAVCHCTYTYGDLLFIQVYSDQATKHCSKVQGKNAVSTVQCCFAKQAGSRQSVTAVTPMEICSSYRCTVTKQQSTAARFRAKMQFPLFSVALQNRLAAGSLSLQLHLWRLALHTGVQ